MNLEPKNLRDGVLFLRLTGVCGADPARQWLPAWYFDICLDGGATIGRCDLRVGHSERTYLGGNIGYLIHAPWRGHRYAARACRLLLKLARRQGMDHLYISCESGNAASARTCELAGGALVETAPVPVDSDMYASGARLVKIYRFEV